MNAIYTDKNVVATCNLAIENSLVLQEYDIHLVVLTLFKFRSPFPIASSSNFPVSPHFPFFYRSAKCSSYILNSVKKTGSTLNSTSKALYIVHTYHKTML